MQQQKIFQIPSFLTVEAEGRAFYQCADGWLADAMGEIIGGIAANPESPWPVPGLSGFLVSGRKHAGGFEISVSRHENQNGTPLDLPLPISRSFIAMDDGDAVPIAAAALAAAADHHHVHPAWTEAMTQVPDAPFTAVVPNQGLFTALRAGLISTDELQTCTGFFQTIIAHILDAAGIEATPPEHVAIDEGDTKEELDTTDIVGAIQTGGAPVNTLIIEPGEDGYPNVYAYLTDLEMDVIRVEFWSSGEIEMDTDAAKYMLLNRDILDLLSDIAEEAELLWDEMHPLADDYHDALLARDDDATVDAPEDPLASFYTQHDRVEVSPELEERLKAHLGIAQIYGAGADT